MKSRVLVPELMDDPKIDPVEHRRALNGLRRVNRLCMTGKQIANEILGVAQKNNSSSLRILDLGCGSGDVACDVARRLAGRIDCQIVGWDISHTAVDCANLSWSKSQNGIQASQLSTTQVRFEQADVFAVNDCKFDVVYCCLFLHHFTESQAVEVLRAMKRLASISVLVDDLIRSHWGYLLAQLGCRMLSRSPVVHFDGPQSVRAAFNASEASRLAHEAGLEPCSIRRHWPERYLLRWDA